MAELRSGSDGLRYRALWLAIGWLGVALLVYLSLVPRPHHMLTFPVGDKIEHIAAFGVTMAWFGQIYRLPPLRLAILLALLVLGLLLEIGQRALGGYAAVELDDVVASAVGSLSGWWLLSSPLGGALTWIEGTFLPEPD